MEQKAAGETRSERFSKLFLPILVALISVGGVILAALINRMSLPFSVVTLDQQIQSVSEVLDALEVPAMLYSDQLKVIYANDKMAAMYRMQKNDMVGKTPDMLNLALKPYIENYTEFAADQLDRIAKGHRGEPQGRAHVPMRLTAQYLNRPAPSSWYFVSNPVFIGKKRFILSQLLEQFGEAAPAAPAAHNSR